MTRATNRGDDAPDYVIGRDAQGHWLAVETHGRGGGLFASQHAALSYARSEIARRHGTIAISEQPIRLV